MEEKMFRNLSIEKCWLPLTASVLEAHNIVMVTSKGDDAQYCIQMMGIMELLKGLYGSAIDNETLNKFLRIFIYVMEFIYGNPYDKESHPFKQYVNVEDYFNNIKKHWNDDISKELKKNREC